MNQFDRNNLVRQRAWIDQQLAQDDAMRQRQPPYAYLPTIAPSFQPPPSVSQPQFFIKTVNSIDETNDYKADPGIWYYFIDVAHEKIYHKKLNDKLFTETVVYSLNKEETAKEPVKDSISERLDKIEKFLEGLKNEHISGNAVSDKPE
jgi:hypothetical protein